MQCQRAKPTAMQRVIYLKDLTFVVMGGTSSRLHRFTIPTIVTNGWKDMRRARLICSQCPRLYKTSLTLRKRKMHQGKRSHLPQLPQKKQTCPSGAYQRKCSV